jgi:serine protease DegQ
MRRLWLLFSQAVTVVLGCLLVIQVLKPGWWATLSPSKASPDVLTTLPAAVAPAVRHSAPAMHSYHDAASRAAPAVVSIVTSKAARGRSAESDEWFRYFFGDRGHPKGHGGSQSGLGSGVIVSPDGYLLTNNHVVAGADTVSVQLNDGREADAKVVGTDPETDLAVLKIELDKLPVVSFGNAKALRVGDVVLAIGNPFNVGQTVTGGIVSALGRNRLGLQPLRTSFKRMPPSIPGTQAAPWSTPRARWLASTPPFSAAAAATWALVLPCRRIPPKWCWPAWSRTAR